VARWARGVGEGFEFAFAFGFRGHGLFDAEEFFVGAADFAAGAEDGDFEEAGLD
jgi:hypothetical protein